MNSADRATRRLRTDTDPAVPFVTRLRVKNFGSIADADVAFGPLSVLIGLNAQPAEKPRDAKGRLTHQRSKHNPYKPVIDQAPLTSTMDLTQARANSPSFDKLHRDVTRLLTGTEPR